MRRPLKALLICASLASCSPELESASPSIETCQAEWEAKLNELEAVQALLVGRGENGDPESSGASRAELVTYWESVLRIALDDYDYVYLDDDTSAVAQWSMSWGDASPEEVDPDFRAACRQLRALAQSEAGERKGATAGDLARRIEEQRSRLAAQVKLVSSITPTRPRDIEAPSPASHVLLAATRDGDAERIVRAGERALHSGSGSPDSDLPLDQERHDRLAHELAVAGLRLDRAIAEAAGGDATTVLPGALDLALPRGAVEALSAQLANARAETANAVFLAAFCRSAREEVQRIQTELTSALETQAKGFDTEDVSVVAWFEGPGLGHSHRTLRAGERADGVDPTSEAARLLEDARAAWKKAATRVLSALDAVEFKVSAVTLKDPHYERGRRRLDVLAALAEALDSCAAQMESFLDDQRQLREEHALAVRDLRARRTEVISAAYAPRPTR